MKIMIPRPVLLLTAAFFILLLTEVTFAQLNTNLLILTFNDKDSTNGIHAFNFDSKNGSFERKQPVFELENSFYFTVSADGKNIYTNSGDRVNSFKLHQKSGKITYLNKAPSNGSCYVSVDKNKKTVFVADYLGGNVLAIPLAKDGSFKEKNLQKIKHQKSGSGHPQDKPRVHAAVLSPDEKHLFVPDLGTDQVFVYQYTSENNLPLKPTPTSLIKTTPGAGPRHLAFHPNGKFVYVVHQTIAQVSVFDYLDGMLKEKQIISMVDSNFTGKHSGADVLVSPDGKFLYASNREDANEIVIFSIGKQGKLTLLKKQSSLGKRPVNIKMDPTGNFMLVANQFTNEVIIFRRDQNSGMLSQTGKKISVNKPVCIQFVK